jgi:hypothetical protein
MIPVPFTFRFLRKLRVILLALSFLSVPALSQNSTSPVAPAPLITFTLDFPQSNPAQYSIAVDATGHAHYECTGTVQEDSDPQAYRMEFEVSASTREKIFQWTKQAKYFAGKIDSGNDKLAFTGAKVLSYQDAQRSNTARYNYSNLQPVRDLTTLLQSMAGTLEYGRRLGYFHHYQKLALDAELKRMDAQARNNELAEVQAVAPILQRIADDSTVINVVRARARDLLKYGEVAARQ